MKHFWGHLQHLQKWSTVTSVVFCLLLYYSFKVHMPLFVITFFPVAGHRSWQRLQIATTWLVIGHLGEVGCCECFQIWEKCKYGSYFFLQLIVHAQSVALQWHILLKNENSNHDVIYCTELQTHWHLKCHLQSDTYHDITQIINILVFLLFRHALSVFGECSIYKYRCSMFSWTNWRKVDVDFQESVPTVCLHLTVTKTDKEVAFFLETPIGYCKNVSTATGFTALFQYIWLNRCKQFFNHFHYH